MFKSNSFANKVGYILGAPFVQAFHVELDYGENRVGFGNKVHAAGAHIYGFKPVVDEPTDQTSESTNGEDTASGKDAQAENDGTIVD